MRFERIEDAAVYLTIAERDRSRISDVLEWSGAHVAGARQIMGGLLPERTGEVPRNWPLAVICGSGYRSTVAASVLERDGFTNVASVGGGMVAWQQAGLPTEGS